MTNLSPAEQRDLLLSVGTHRGTRRLSPVEVARLFARELSCGTAMRELGASFRISPTMVGRFQRLLRLSDDIQHIVGWQGGEGEVSFTSAFEIARIADKCQHWAVARAIMEHGLSSSETRQIVQLHERSGRPVNECIAEVLGMRPRIEIRHVYIGTVLDEDLRRRLGAMSQAERDLLVKEVLAREFPDLPVRSSRLGPSRFTLVGGADLGAGLSESLERDLNARLAGSLKG